MRATMRHRLLPPQATRRLRAPSFATGASDAESDEDDPAHGHGELVPRRKPGGYDSRIEQILYENPELPLLITDAGKSMESGGRYIVYTIRTGVSWPGAASARREIANCPPGSRSPAAILGVRLPERRTDKTASDAHHPPDSREAHHGRLRSEPDKRQTGPADHRPEEAHACRLPQPVPADGAGAHRWRLVSRFLDPNASWVRSSCASLAVFSS